MIPTNLGTTATLNSPTVNWDYAESLPEIRAMEDALIRAQRTPSIEEGRLQLIAELGAELGAAAGGALEEPSAVIKAARLARDASAVAWLAEKALAEQAAESAVQAFATLTAPQRKALRAVVGGKTYTATVGSWGATVAGGLLREPNQPPSAVFSDWAFQSGDGGGDRAVEAWAPSRVVTAEDIAAARGV